MCSVVGFVYRILETRLGPEMKEKVTSVSLSQNGDSAIFDIPTADKDTVGGMTLIVAVLTSTFMINY